MTERLKAFWLGLFVIICAALIIWLVLFLRPSVGDAKKTLKIRFSNIEKVAVGTRVTLAGKPVGQVVAIHEIFDARDQPTDKGGNVYYYELLVRVDSGVHVYNYDEIVFSTAGLLGEKTIAIIPKHAPQGFPPAHELSDGVLYARSTDKLEEALTKLVDVADVFEQTMCEMLCFFKENSEDIHVAISSFGSTCKQADRFFARANECDLAGNFATFFHQAVEGNFVPLFNDTLFNLRNITGQVAAGQGSLGKMLYSDDLYYVLSASLSRFEQVLSDIHNFGLFFQFDKGWQRNKRAQYREMQNYTGSTDFYNYFNEEISAISTSLERVGKAIEKMRGNKVNMENPRLTDLVKKIDSLEANLKATNQNFMNTKKWIERQ